MELLKEIKMEARAYNKCLTDEYLDNLTPTELLGVCHPFHREEYLSRLVKQGLITEEEKKSYQKMVGEKN